MPRAVTRPSCVLQLYHGTLAEAPFDRFDRSHAQTASHIYLTDEPACALGYAMGSRSPQPDPTVLVVQADLGRHLNLLPDDMGLPEWKALSKVAANLAQDWGLEPRELEDKIIGGELYDYASSPQLQNQVLDEFFSLGWNSVRFLDRAPAGCLAAYPSSFVFEDPARLRIVGRLAEPMRVSNQLAQWLDWQQLAVEPWCEVEAVRPRERMSA